MYLDPSFGGMLLQIIVVIAAVGGAVIYSLRRKIAALFKKNKNPDSHISHEVNNIFDNTTHSSDGLIDTLSDTEK